MKSAVEWGYEGYGAKARDGNETREVEMASWGERLTRIRTEITDVRRAVVVLAAVVGLAAC